MDPSGADSADAGTLQNPFGTIQYAVDQAQAGDTIYVKQGVYNESVSFPHSGSGAFITVQNYENSRPVIDGTGLGVPDDYAGLVLMDNKSYIGWKVSRFATSQHQRDAERL